MSTPVSSPRSRSRCGRTGTGNICCNFWTRRNGKGLGNGERPMTVMPPEGKAPKDRVVVAAVSGGPDSVYLLRKLATGKGRRVVIGHVNYATRGKDSLKDQALVEKIGKIFRYPTVILSEKKEGTARGD